MLCGLGSLIFCLQCRIIILTVDKGAVLLLLTFLGIKLVSTAEKSNCFQQNIVICYNDTFNKQQKINMCLSLFVWEENRQDIAITFLGIHDNPSWGWNGTEQIGDSPVCHSPSGQPPS